MKLPENVYHKNSRKSKFEEDILIIVRIYLHKRIRDDKENQDNNQWANHSKL